MNKQAQELIQIARPLVGEIPLGREDMSAASVAAAIRTKAGNTYTGVCIHVSCGIGFCAEHAAVAEMIQGARDRGRYDRGSRRRLHLVALR